MDWLHDAWHRMRVLAAVLAIVRFSILIPAVLAVTLLVADQMIDILRAVGEEGRRPAVAWLLVMSTFTGLVVWYGARTMLRFRFAANSASDPQVHPRLKRQLPRLLGVSIPGMLAVRVAILAATGGAGHSEGLWIFTGALTVVTGVVAAFVFQRRQIAASVGLHALAVSESREGRSLARVRELPATTQRVLIALLGTNAIALALFMWAPFYSSGGPVKLGAPAILLLGLGLTTVVGNSLVYVANHHGIPIITTFGLWALLCSIGNDNHLPRVVAAEKPSGFLLRVSDAAPVRSSPFAQSTLQQYFRDWFKDLDSLPNHGPIPVFIVSAEGGGLRAAYWTAMVLAALEDETAAKGAPFSRHVFAISGVSGGSVGAALFDASVASRVSLKGSAKSRVDEMGEMLSKDFLSDTLGAGLFPDLLQRFLPAPILADRALALDQSFDRAWEDEHTADPTRLRASFQDLWSEQPYRVPLLFLNSTAVETGQRAINSPFSTASTSADWPFADSLSVHELIGGGVPLSTAALLSARFTYVSPAALIDSHGAHDPNWLRLVDGGYFDNSGAVTAQEIARMVIESNLICGSAGGPAAGLPCAKLIVLHLPNEPEKASDISDQRAREKGSSGRWERMSEILAPINALLQTRAARGTQAVKFLQGEPGVQLVSLRPCTEQVTAPLGWVLSSQVRKDMKAQLDACKDPDGNCAGAKIRWVEKILNEDASTAMPAVFNEPTACPTPKVR
jgi:hypothetical protein